MSGASPAQIGGKLGRYELHGAIARGGMATVYVARMSGAAGFARTVAVKRLHPHLAADPTFSAMFIDEARLAARIRHPNVVDTLDVVAEGGELFLVMDFVLGETLAKLGKATTQRGITLPSPVVSAIIIGALEGLHAAHDATNERGEPLGIVHRDISPQNILVARDGVARVLDFGVAKAAGRVQETEGGEIKGKLAYMAPEQLTRKSIDRRCDLFAMGIVLWEALTSQRLFAGDDAASTLYAVMNQEIVPPSRVVAGIPPALDAVVLKALERDADKRYSSAQEMAMALEGACPPAPTRHVGKWVEDLAADALKIRSEILRAIDHAQSGNGPVAIPTDDQGLGSQVLASSAFVSATATTEYHQQPSQPIMPVDSGIHGISAVTRASSSGVTSPSGVSSTSSMSNVTHTHTIPFAPIQERLEQSTTKLAILGGIFAAIAIVGIVMGVIAIRARQVAAANAVMASASAAGTTQAPPPAMTTASPLPAVAPMQSAPVSAADAGAPKAAPVYTGPPRSTPKQGGKAGANDCADPFTTDANGIKHPKIQCLGH